MTYSCPVCGIADQNAYLRCYEGGCPDGRDQARNSPAAIAERNKSLHAKEPPSYYMTPPNWRKCMNYREHGATPCWYPHCGCFSTPQSSPTQHNPWTLLLTASILGLIVALFVLIGAPRAHAHSDKGFHPNHATTQWFDRLMRPDFADSPCCGKVDFYPVSRYWENKDSNGTPTGTWSAEIADGSPLVYPDGTVRPYLPTGTIVEVYDGKVNKLEDDLDNPTDTSWISVRVVDGKAANVYCLIRHPMGN